MFPGTNVTLGGTDYLLPGMSLAWMYENDETLRILREPQNVSVTEYTKSAVPLVLHAIQRNYPDMTRERLLELLDAATVMDLAQLVFINSGFRPLMPTAPAGVAPEAGDANSPAKTLSESSSTEPAGSPTTS